MTVADYKAEISQMVDLPDKLKLLIQSEINLLEESRKSRVVKPMSIYVFNAKQ
ncbi:hypothetical protein GGGNBK_00950 [Sporosarcina sp. ANT_H38]